MGNKKPAAERNLGLFLSPAGAAGQGGYLVPMDNLNVGPGKPGPGDKWEMPVAPEEIEGAGPPCLLPPRAPSNRRAIPPAGAAEEPARSSRPAERDGATRRAAQCLGRPARC